MLGFMVEEFGLSGSAGFYRSIKLFPYFPQGEAGEKIPSYDNARQTIFPGKNGDFFQKMSLDPFGPKLYISNSNQVFEPSYTVCIKCDFCPGDHRYLTEINTFSSPNEKMLNCLIKTDTVYL
jgi:hypothetical protein